MGVDAAERRARGKRIEQRPQPPTAQPPPTNFTAAMGVISVVIRSTREEIDHGGPIVVQRVRHASSPPVAGEPPIAEGDWFEAYPFHCSLPPLYARLAWGPADPLTFLTYPLTVFNDGGHWTLQIPLNGVPTEVDPNQPSSGCSR